MKHSELLELLAHELSAAFNARFAAADYTVDSIPFYGLRTLKAFDIAANPDAVIRDVIQALAAMKARGQLRFHNDDFPAAGDAQSVILAVPPCVISIGPGPANARETITFRFDVEVTPGRTRVAP